MTSWWSRADEEARQAPIKSLVKCTYSALLWVYSHVMADKTIWCYINNKSLFLPTVAYPVEADFTPGMHTRSNVKYLLTPGAPVGWGCPLCCPLLQPLVFSPGLWLKGTGHSRLPEEWLISVSIEGFCPVQASRVLQPQILDQIYNFMVKDDTVFTYCGV